MRDFTPFTWSLVGILAVTLFFAGATMSCGTDNEEETAIFQSF